MEERISQPPALLDQGVNPALHYILTVVLWIVGIVLSIRLFLNGLFFFFAFWGDWSLYGWSPVPILFLPLIIAVIRYIVQIEGIPPGDRVMGVLLNATIPGLGQFLTGQYRRGIWYVSLFGMIYATDQSLALGMGSHYTESQSQLFLWITSTLLAAGAVMDLHPRLNRKSLFSLAVWFGAFCMLFSSPAWTKLLFYEVRVVGSEGMSPTLIPDDQIIISKWNTDRHPPEHEDIVVYRLRYEYPPYTDYIQRVLAEPGEKAVFRKGKLFVNGVLVPEPYVKANNKFSMNFGTLDKDIYLMGPDNRLFGIQNGPVHDSEIIGVATFRFWPPVRFGTINGHTHPTEKANESVAH